MSSENFIVQEISAYEGQLIALEALKKKVQEAKIDLADSYHGIIDVKKEFETIKKQNIEELRLYKFSVKAECSEIKSQIDLINKTVASMASSELKVFVESCEKLAALEKSGFFNKLRINS